MYVDNLVIAHCFQLVSSLCAERVHSFAWVSLVGGASGLVPQSELGSDLRWKWRSKKNRELIWRVNPLSGWYFSADHPPTPHPSPPPAGFQLSDRLVGDSVEHPETSHLLSFTSRDVESDTTRHPTLKNWPNSICVGLLTFITWHIHIWYIADFKIMLNLVLLEQINKAFSLKLFLILNLHQKSYSSFRELAARWRNVLKWGSLSYLYWAQRTRGCMFIEEVFRPFT